MNSTSIASRYWVRLTEQNGMIVTGPRNRTGYSLWQRYWASLTGLRLPPRGQPMPMPDIRTQLADHAAADGWTTRRIQELTDALVGSRDPAQRRITATRLLSALQELGPTSTIPEPLERITTLLASLSSENRFLAFSVQRLLDRLNGQGLLVSPRIDTRLAMAAEEQHESDIVKVQRDPFVLSLSVSGSGQIRITVSAALDQQDAQFVTDVYGTMLLPISVRDNTSTTQVLMVMLTNAGEMHGEIALPAPRGHFVMAELDSAPIGVAEIVDVPGPDIIRSVAAVSNKSALAMWREMATRLPPEHPIHGVLEF